MSAIDPTLLIVGFLFGVAVFASICLAVLLVALVGAWNALRWLSREDKAKAP